MMYTNPKVSLLLVIQNNEQHLPHWLASITQQPLWPEMELIICANNPGLEEEKILLNFKASWQHQVKLLMVSKEALDASLHRCMKEATAQYLAIANVVDLRTPSSMECKVKALENGTPPKFTVLTDIIREDPENKKSKFLGHYGVTRSLLEGLMNINANFNFNPDRIADVAENLLVLSGVPTVLQGIYLKRLGKIKRLIVGPNIMVRSNQFGGIMALPEIDLCIVPSDWVRIAYGEDAPDLIGRIKVWYAGINERFWQPEHTAPRGNYVLVYWKTESEEFICEIEDKLRKYGWQPIRLRYGHYKAEDYRKLLAKSAFGVFISISESQGLALAEAWSMDVPTVVWNPQRLKKHYQDVDYYSTVSSCPYLNPMVGVEWKEMEQFEAFFAHAPETLPNFQPRKWILENMTDIIAAQKMVELVFSY